MYGYIRTDILEKGYLRQGRNGFDEVQDAESEVEIVWTCNKEMHWCLVGRCERLTSDGFGRKRGRST